MPYCYLFIYLFVSCTYIVNVRRGFLFLLVLGMGYVILLRHSLGLPCYYFTCNYVVSVRRGFLFLLMLGKCHIILLRHSLGLPYNCFGSELACGTNLKQVHWGPVVRN